MTEQVESQDYMGVRVPQGRVEFWERWVEENPKEAAKMLALKELLAEHDTLTELLNRRGLERRILEKVSDLTRTDSGFSYLFIDMDRLKKVNDKYGHKKGDEFIMAVARAISVSVREGDVYGRWGGDEFVAMLPGVDRDKAYEVVVRINERIPEGYSVSVGVGVWNQGENPLDLLEEAERDMYRIKHAGLDVGERSTGVDVVDLE